MEIKQHSRYLQPTEPVEAYDLRQYLISLTLHFTFDSFLHFPPSFVTRTHIMAARRPTRSSKPPASPSTSSSSHTDVDIDHLAGQMLATLGISKKSSLPSSSANNNHNNVRTTRSSSKDALSALATATTPVMKSRTVSCTSNVTSASPARTARTEP